MILIRICADCNQVNWNYSFHFLIGDVKIDPIRDPAGEVYPYYYLN